MGLAPQMQAPEGGQPVTIDQASNISQQLHPSDQVHSMADAHEWPAHHIHQLQKRLQTLRRNADDWEDEVGDDDLTQPIDAFAGVDFLRRLARRVGQVRFSPAFSGCDSPGTSLRRAQGAG